MYIFGDNFRPILAWNAVNVRDKDGFLRHGNVINVADGGLIVDFGCPSQRAEFVEYGQAFDCAGFPFAISRPERLYGGYYGQYRPEFIKNGVEVLIRVRLDRPWTWRPGKLLECDFGSCCFESLLYSFVEVETEGDTVKELVPDTQVRLALSAEDLNKQLIEKDDFVIRSCSLPKNYWSAFSFILSSLFSRDLEHEYKVGIVSVFSDRLTYLQRFPEMPIQSEQLDEVCKKGRKEVASYAERGLEYPHKDWICRRIFPQTISTVGHAKLSRSALPVELFVEIFQCLDTIGRLRCRRICALWNTILSQQSMFTDVWVSFAEASFSPSPDYTWNPFYAATGCFVKCITKFTQRIIITDLKKDDYAEFGEITSLVTPLLKNPRMKQLIFGNSLLGWCYGDNMEKAVESIVKNCARFDMLTFRNCTVPFQLDGEEFRVDIADGSVKLGAPDVVIRIWDFVESHCGVCDPALTTDYWLSRRVLNKVQSCDPRQTSHYRGKEWTKEDTIHLDPSKLTRLTLHALFHDSTG